MYYGGDKPDEADFMLFGVLKSRTMCPSFNRFLEDEMPRQLSKWYDRMNGHCSYTEREYMD